VLLIKEHGWGGVKAKRVLSVIDLRAWIEG